MGNLNEHLFDFEADSFTGAVRSKPGMLGLCSKGTIFLDEIGELPSPLQAKVLQVIQDHQFCRLGGRALVTVDVRNLIFLVGLADEPEFVASSELGEILRVI
jgi:transcriptional regulator with PAS, ATPase and Fis domain